MQNMHRKFLSLLGATPNSIPAKSQKASPELSTQAPNLSSSSDNTFEETTYADAHKTPQKTLHRIMLESTIDREDALSRLQKSTSSGARSSSNNLAVSPSTRPRVTTRSPWDAEDDEFNPDVYKDVRRSNVLYKASYGSIKQLHLHQLNSNPSLHSLRSKASTSSIKTTYSSVHRMHQSSSASAPRDLRRMASTSSIKTVSSVGSATTIVYRPVRKARRSTSALHENHGSAVHGHISNSREYQHEQREREQEEVDEDMRREEEEQELLRQEEEEMQCRREEMDVHLREEENNRDLAEEIKGELKDPACMSLTGDDLHDKIIAELYVDVYPRLPAYEETRRMHIIDLERLENTADVGFLYVSPRLCDAVATILFQAGPSILEAFIDLHDHKTFEWCRRNPTSSETDGFVVRRDHTAITVGVYFDKGSHYVWGHYIKAVVDLMGKWTVTFTAPCLGTTMVTDNGLSWDSFELVDVPVGDAYSDDPVYALFTERCLARMLLKMAWDWDHICCEASEFIAGEKGESNTSDDVESKKTSGCSS